MHALILISSSPQFTLDRSPFARGFRFYLLAWTLIVGGIGIAIFIWGFDLTSDLPFPTPASINRFPVVVDAEDVSEFL